ncbi:septum formation protein Maf [bacterium BMS3Bbin03]|nr:septum formation protein Maf [bacterium BMS3Bbin03]
MPMKFIELPRPLILASESPRRAQLLRQAGFEFQIIPSNVSEGFRENQSPESCVTELALQKTKDVAEKVSEGIIVGADTIVVLDSRILGKPADRADARKMLRFLSGRTHEVFTGFAIITRPENKIVTNFERTKVTFRPLEDWEIDRYIEIDHPFDKAGAYGIQDTSAIFVESICGCYYNVVGFPLTKFYVQLKSVLAELAS